MPVDLGDGLGNMVTPPWVELFAPGFNPVRALRDLTPGGAAIDYNSRAYGSGGDSAKIFALVFAVAGAGGGGGGGARAAAAESELPGLPASAPKPLGLGSTGRSIPGNLSEQLAMEEAMSNPAAGTPVRMPHPMRDPRWPASNGWIKMEQRGNQIHYVWNTITGQADDFKF